MRKKPVKSDGYIRVEEFRATTVTVRLEWSTESLLKLRPKWTLEQCIIWLRDHGDELKERLTEHGWHTLRQMVPIEPPKPEWDRNYYTRKRAKQ